MNGMIPLRLCLPALVCVLLAACGQAGEGVPPAPEPAVEPVESTAMQQTAGPSVLGDILECHPEDLLDFSFFDTPRLYSREDGAVFPEDGAGAVTFDCGYQSLYGEEQTALTRQLAGALADYRVEGPRPVDGADPLPTGRHFTLWPSLASGWNPVLTFFDSGEIYVDANGGGDGVHRCWQAADPAQFDALLAVLGGIQRSLDALPLDFQMSMWLSPEKFKPVSTALRLGLENIGVDTVTARRLTLERRAGDGWQAVGDIETPDLSVGPRAVARYAVDLTAIPGAQETGEYRVRGTLETAGERAPLELLYSIDEDAYEIGHPLPPEMTPENAEYCRRYVGMWGFYTPFSTDFDEENYLVDFHTYHLYYIMASTEGKEREYERAYGADLPAEVVEGTILRHFLFTEEQLRAGTASKAQGGSEYYDPATNTYHFAGGYGGGSSTAVVSDSRREGDLLTLTCDWYGMDDEYLSSQELTLRLGEGEYDFVYVAGRMLWDGAAQ